MMIIITLFVSGIMVFAYYKRHTVTQDRWVNKFLYNDVVVIALASIAMISMAIDSSKLIATSKRQSKASKRKHEFLVQKALGYHMARKLSLDYKNNTRILVIDTAINSIQQLVHQSFMAGFKEGLIKPVKDIPEEFIPSMATIGNQNNNFTEHFIVQQKTFDDIVEKYDSVSLIVSLVGLPRDYENSRTHLRVSRGEFKLCIVTDDPFVLGGVVRGKEVVSCVVPKSSLHKKYKYETLITEDMEALFRKNYDYITSDNILAVMRENRRLFRVYRHF